MDHEWNAVPADLDFSVDDMLTVIDDEFNETAIADAARAKIANGTLVIGEAKLKPEFENLPAYKDAKAGTLGKHAWWSPDENGGVQVIIIKTADADIVQAAHRLLHELDHFGGFPGSPSPGGGPRKDPTTNSDKTNCASCNHAKYHVKNFNRLSALECSEGFETAARFKRAMDDSARTIAGYLAACAASACPEASAADDELDCCELYNQYPEICL